MRTFRRTKREATVETPILKGRKKQRGVVLLLVLSLLTLFILIGVTYALVAMQYKNASRSNAQIELVGDSPEGEMEIVLAQLLYDTAARSSIASHSLLADLYGSDFIKGTGTGFSNSQFGGQVLSFTYAYVSDGVGAGSMSQIADYYTGRVLTFLDGDAAGFSTRIVAYVPTSATAGTLFVETRDTKLPTNGCSFLINGGPFNGPGMGYAASTYNLDQLANFNAIDAMYTENDDFVALLPHFGGYRTLPPTASFQNADETWDAVDYQNMYMALVPADASLGKMPSFHRPDLVRYWYSKLEAKYVLDSTNARQILNFPYGANGIDENGAGDDPNSMQVNDHPNSLDYIAAMKRHFIFRPSKEDHRNFTGSNPSFDPINGPWDVDNDGDGINESIWVDPGLPIVTASNGRRYKRLVAICVKDLDSRINVNVHGNVQQVAHANFRSETQVPAGFGLAGGSYVPRGQGYGPAEVDFLHLFGTFSAAANLAASDNTTPEGQYVLFLKSRYGTDGAPGLPNVNDALSVVKHQGVPAHFEPLGAGVAPQWYNSPPDVWGRRAIALDQTGQPTTSYLASGSLPTPTFSENTDDPYEMEFDAATAVNDSPYTLAELERLLRFHDPDAISLPDRLIRAGADADQYNVFADPSEPPGVVGITHRRRELLTTISSHVNATQTIVPPIQRATLGGSSGMLLDLYRAKLAAGGATNIADQLQKIVPWEIRHGVPFDINRYLGNGQDDNGNYTSDELAELGNETAWTQTGIPTSFSTVTAHPNNDVDVDGTSGANTAINRRLSKHLYARHLYCLMLLLMDDSPLFDDNSYLRNKSPAPAETTLTQTERTQLFRRRIAQWAINVVDFRDPDSIMTPFEYDQNPWNGWGVDGILDTTGAGDTQLNERDLVWGCEYPDLLLTETIAFHDRRVKDTDKAGPMDKKVEDNTAMHDTDLDQFRVPQGSLFIELYCPKNRYASDPGLPWELYNRTNSKLMLHKYVSDGTNNYPVWRLALGEITRGTTAAMQARSPSSRATSNPESTSFDPRGGNSPYDMATGAYPSVTGMSLTGSTDQRLTINRYVWFTDGGSEGNVSTVGGGSVFYTSAMPELSPGQYAVIAPRAITYLGSRVSTDAATLWGGNSQKRIELTTNDVVITDGAGMAPVDPILGTNKGPILPIIADMPKPPAWMTNTKLGMFRVGLNITEPLPNNYYPEPTEHTGAAGTEDFYDDPAGAIGGYLDQPLDSVSGRPLQRHDMLRTATYENVSSVFLQRLADPTQMYNAVTNPYLTVDWATIDCTVFSGEENTNKQVAQGVGGGMVDIDSEDPPEAGGAGRNLSFQTRERGMLRGGNRIGNIWPPDATFKGQTDPDPATPAEDYFKHALTADSTQTNKNYQTLGYVNEDVAHPQASPNVGDPDVPIPWITWLNRPFNNPYELMLVPTSSPARLCYEISPGSLTAPSGTSPYAASPSATDGSDPSIRANFSHLLNFYNTSTTQGAAPHFYRLFDYVEVPSPFVGTERWYNPSQFTSNPSAYYPPFNKLARLRDPGRININTVTDNRVFEAAFKSLGLATSETAFINNIVRSRQGYNGALYTPDPTKPTIFANPFRTADSADLMPNVANLRLQHPVQATFLRGQELPPSAPTEPLFHVEVSAPIRYTEEDHTKNAYFEYQTMQKIGSVFTTRSNCFAVWMTVGYFEAEPNLNASNVVTVDAAHPDGYRLGQELGIDTGEVTRHRSFYIIDRSVPAAFEPGKKHNTDNCVLLRRFIE